MFSCTPSFNFEPFEHASLGGGRPGVLCERGFFVPEWSERVDFHSSVLRTIIPKIFSSIAMNYCTAHDGWDVTGYQGLFCPLNKPSCDRLSGCVQLVKAVVGGCS